MTSPPNSRNGFGTCSDFLLEASKYNVFPLDDRRYERFNSDLAGRPQLVKGNTQMQFGGMGRLSENSVINLKNKSHAITADLAVEAADASGVIIAQGGRFGGWALTSSTANRPSATTCSACSSSRFMATRDSTPVIRQER
jgi:hypothetical protein